MHNFMNSTSLKNRNKYIVSILQYEKNMNAMYSIKLKISMFSVFDRKVYDENN